jgi:hypothetical protein
MCTLVPTTSLSFAAMATNVYILKEHRKFSFTVGATFLKIVTQSKTM